MTVAHGRMTGMVLVGTLVAGCGRRAEPPAGAAQVAAVEIVSPATGDTVSLPVTVRLGASGVVIAPATGTREEGVGHHHLVVDVDLSAEGQPIPSGNGFIHMGSGASEWVLDSLPPGPHRIIARLAWGDHVPILGGVTDTIMIVVR